ncbi:MAG: alcohol dehydrogenase catalytic domain-containing protein [Clostridia bacterium]|nr:alcohol dehydrogenase catalytic domain-containing protein [Clostridia bacterium]
MKALYVLGPNQLKFCETEEPAFNEEQVLIKVQYSMMCSSDVKLIRGDFHGLKLPLIPGHEWSGVVAKAPEKYQYLVGKKVVVDILFPCQQCEQCRKSRRNLCENMNEIGVNLNGGYAEYVVADVKNVIPIPDSISLKDACLIEPLAVVYNAIQRVGIRPAEKVAILGSGVIGLLLVSLAKQMGATQIQVMDYIGDRLKIASSLGATATYDMNQGNLVEDYKKGWMPLPDVVFDATGSADAFNTALEIVKPGGRIGYIGYSAHEKVNIEPSMIMLKSITIYGVLSPTETWLQAIELIENKVIDTEKLITHEFPLEEYETVLNLMKERKDGIIRSVFKF